MNTDADGTFHVPFWVKVFMAIPFIPEPWKSIIRLSVEIFDILPAPHQEVVLGAIAQAQVKGDHLIAVRAMHEAILAVQRDATDRTH